MCLLILPLPMVIKLPFPLIGYQLFINSWGVLRGVPLTAHHFSPFRQYVAFTVVILALPLSGHPPTLQGPQSCTTIRVTSLGEQSGLKQIWKMLLMYTFSSLWFLLPPSYSSSAIFLFENCPHFFLLT